VSAADSEAELKVDEADSRREAEVEDAWSMMLVRNELVESRRAEKDEDR
jgi:hypothetical protein